MSGSIKFSMNGSMLQTEIVLPRTNSVRTVMTSLGNKSPLDVLKDIQTQLTIVFTFGEHGTLDQVVEDIIVKMGEKRIVKPSVSAIKEYAKAYYRVWANKTKYGMSNDDGDYNRQTASIIIDMLSWWYIRRLVHVYVVCAILEGVHNTTQSLSSPSYNAKIRYSSVDDYGRNARDEEIDKLKLKYNTDVSILQTTHDQLQRDFKTLLGNYTRLENEYNTLYKEREEQDEMIASFEQKLAGFKELLLHSTSMIFKIEEVPNMVKYG